MISYHAVGVSDYDILDPLEPIVTPWMFCKTAVRWTHLLPHQSGPAISISRVQIFIDDQGYNIYIMVDMADILPNLKSFGQPDMQEGGKAKKKPAAKKPAAKKPAAKKPAAKKPAAKKPAAKKH